MEKVQCIEGDNFKGEQIFNPRTLQMSDDTFTIAEFSQEMILSTYTNLDVPFIPRVLLEVLRCLKIPPYMNGVSKTKAAFKKAFGDLYWHVFLTRFEKTRSTSNAEFINIMTLVCLHLSQSSSSLFDLFLVCSFIDFLLDDELEDAIGEDGCFRFMEPALRSLIVVIHRRFKQLFDDPRGRKHIQAYCETIGEYYDTLPLDKYDSVQVDDEVMGLFLTGSKSSLLRAYRLLYEGEVVPFIDLKLSEDELSSPIENIATSNASDVTEYPTNWTRDFKFENYYPTYTCRGEDKEFLDLSAYRRYDPLQISVAFPKYASESIVTRENRCTREPQIEEPDTLPNSDTDVDASVENCFEWNFERLKCAELICDDDTASSLHSPRFSIFHEATCSTCNTNCFGIVVRFIERHRSQFPDEKTVEEIRKTTDFSMYDDYIASSSDDESEDEVCSTASEDEEIVENEIEDCGNE